MTAMFKTLVYVRAFAGGLAGAGLLTIGVGGLLGGSFMIGLLVASLGAYVLADMWAFDIYRHGAGNLFQSLANAISR